MFAVQLAANACTSLQLQERGKLKQLLTQVGSGECHNQQSHAKLCSRCGFTTVLCQRSAYHEHHPQLVQSLFYIRVASGHFSEAGEPLASPWHQGLGILVLWLAEGMAPFACRRTYTHIHMRENVYRWCLCFDICLTAGHYCLHSNVEAITPDH